MRAFSGIRDAIQERVERESKDWEIWAANREREKRVFYTSFSCSIPRSRVRNLAPVRFRGIEMQIEEVFSQQRTSSPITGSQPRSFEHEQNKNLCDEIETLPGFPVSSPLKCSPSFSRVRTETDEEKKNCHHLSPSFITIFILSLA